VPSNNFNNSSINGDLIQNAQKGMQFNTPLSRFGPIRPLIVLEWTPLETVGKYGTPVRFPFFINPQSISFTHEHSYSQQQTRGGWVHTHWNDKPLMIKLHGNSGLYQKDFIDILRFYSKISGKTYLELDVYQKNKNAYRDKFLSEFLSPSDAKKLLSILGATTLPASQNTPGGKSYGQSILQGLVTNDSLYQQAKTVGKIAFDNIQRTVTIEATSKAIITLNNDLSIVKQQTINSQATNQSLNKNSQTALKGSAINQSNASSQSDISIKGVFQTLSTIPSNQLINAGLFSSPLDIDNISTLTKLSGIISIFGNGILINPSGSSLGQVTSDAALTNNFSNSQQQFLSNAASVVSSFATFNMRLDNPMQLSNKSLPQILTSFAFLTNYASTLMAKGNNIISLFSLEDDIRDNINILNTFLEGFINNITNLQDELLVLERKIKIQTKRFDSERERKLFKKFDQKYNQILEDIHTVLLLKQNVDVLLVEPLATTADQATTNQKVGDLLVTSESANNFITDVYIKYPGLNLVTDQQAGQIVLNRANELIQNAQKPQNQSDIVLQSKAEGAKQYIDNFKNQNNIITPPGNYTIPDQNQLSSFGSSVKTRTLQQKAAVTNHQNPNLFRADTNAANTATAAPAAFATIMDQLGVASKNLEQRVQGQYSISDSPVAPTYNDVVTIKLYYDGTIYEGFITHFDWQEQAGTPNIEYDMEFLVEREFLGASLSTTPSSLKINPKDVKIMTGGDGINPLMGASSLPSNVVTNVTGRVIPGNQQENRIGQSNPQPYPAIGSAPTNPANPAPGTPGNKVNNPVKNFGISDSSSLTQSNVNNVLQEGQLDLSDIGQ